MGGVNGDPGRGVLERVGVASTTGSGSVTIQRKHVVKGIWSSPLPLIKGGLLGAEMTENPGY